jgi:hypothetical protein
VKTMREIGAQGDVLFRKVDTIPGDYHPQPRAGVLVVAHSETGHHHVISSPDVTLYDNGNPWLCFLRLEAAFADVEHLRPYDTHETLRLLGTEAAFTCFEVRRQREYAPDRDPRVAAMRRVTD